jgi:hypothetical protein
MSANPASFTWQLTAYELHGNLWLKWNTTAPFGAQQGQIEVYSGTSFPSSPQTNAVAGQWDNIDGSGWDTGQSWGTGWCCAWIAEASPNGPYVYVTQLITDGTMGPDVARK